MLSKISKHVNIGKTPSSSVGAYVKNGKFKGNGTEYTVRALDDSMPDEMLKNILSGDVKILGRG